MKIVIFTNSGIDVIDMSSGENIHSYIHLFIYF